MVPSVRDYKEKSSLLIEWLNIEINGDITLLI